MLYQLSYVRVGSILPFSSRHADAGFAGVGCPTLETPLEVIMARAAGRTSSRSGDGRNRTGDTTVFSRVLYQLSYLARRAAV